MFAAASSLTRLLLLVVGQLLDGAALAEAPHRAGQPLPQRVSRAFGTRGAGLQRAEGGLRLEVGHRLGLSIANGIVFCRVIKKEREREIKGEFSSEQRRDSSPDAAAVFLLLNGSSLFWLRRKTRFQHMWTCFFHFEPSCSASFLRRPSAAVTEVNSADRN